MGIEDVMAGAQVTAKTKNQKEAKARADTPTSIADLNLKLTQLCQNGEALTALGKLSRIKRMRTILDLLEAALMPAANTEFVNATGAAVLLDNGAAIAKNYTYAAKYEYPPKIVQDETALKAAKKAAQIDGTALKIDRVMKPTDRLFTITIN